jgi:hypothetical protein
MYLVFVAGALHQLREGVEATGQHAEQLAQVRELAGVVVPRDKPPRLLA